ncbi:MAG TPA: lysylphosphatidylglycerol synthase transmembrane domain-containing protein [Solirubrobacteraceae bacterium]|nr:lysylphosphatidylglycerol synthase transmembrane domain-containing protein [Solirubrobacteraceae bacterium]
MSGEAPQGDRPDLDVTRPVSGTPAGPSTPAQGQAGEPRDEMPRLRLSRRGLTFAALFVGSCLAFLYFVLPKVLGLKDTWSRIEHGNGWWLALGAALEVCSFLSYVVLFRGVFIRGQTQRIGFSVSYQITMASLAATRLFATAGAGGVALTAWALRRSGMHRRAVAQRMITFMTLIYVVFLASLIIGGFGLYLGLLPGRAPFEITLIPALFATVLVGLALAVSFVPGDLDRLVGRWTGTGPLARFAERLAAAPATVGGGIRAGLRLVRTRDPELLGAPGWWGFDIAVLWASFHAFGGSPAVAPLVVAYFIGQLGNLLPLPGGIGGVDGAMIGALSAFGVPGSLAVVSVLAYRAFAFWLPTLPGAVAYFQLRRTVRGWEASEAASNAPAYTL